MVKSESAISMAAVCLGGSMVPASVIIVVEYRLVYQLISRSQAATACLGGSTVPATGSFGWQYNASNKVIFRRQIGTESCR